MPGKKNHRDSQKNEDVLDKSKKYSERQKRFRKS